MNPEQTPAERLLERIEREAEENPRILAYVDGLRREIENLEREQEEKAKTLAAYEEAYEKLTQPANRIGVFLKPLEDGLALVVLGDTEYVALVDPNVDASLLDPGQRVRLNDAYAVVGLAEPASGGGLIKVIDALADGRLRVGESSPGQSGGRLVDRSGALAAAEIKSGDEVRLDASGRLAVEVFPQKEAKDFFIEEIPETPWSAVGGQHEAIRVVKETIELPLLHPELFERFDKKPVKGILLYGPPGCGKTLLGKAIASSLTKEYAARVGREVKECFMHISGPKILNMWLGETERIVREIFSAARERAKEGRLVVIFMDEAESVLRTRSGGRYLNISNTVVPQFCAEMDGLVELENVVLILTSNRPDYIDPAILRPERIDRKVKVVRPDEAAARDILSIYLHSRLPLDPVEAQKHEGEECARRALVESTLAWLWREDSATEFLKVYKANGLTEILHWKDVVSGALLKSVVDRAKDTAIRRAIADPEGAHGVSEADLHRAVEQEFRENEIFPKSDTLEDWLKLIDIEPEQVMKVDPIRPDEFERWRTGGVG
jgi:proteasome-associated ATPase